MCESDTFVWTFTDIMYYLAPYPNPYHPNWPSEPNPFLTPALTLKQVVHSHKSAQVCSVLFEIFLLLFADQTSLCRGGTTVNAGGNETWKTLKVAISYFPLSNSYLLMVFVLPLREREHIYILKHDYRSCFPECEWKKLLFSLNRWGKCLWK